ncbi:uncharacterized protein LOC110444957 isoform X8 [Mizuhopecten yessoensis]|uniref:uncharacterized protein LOC110444957 isoform X8 n=1 Tax=Mizuhopecten yessoensis TaxID=6573 RepID=UPI000B45798E|nr:uncharacterized protein LOC110444957 isoform X8 [Mizuhopecten yessoensis]
MKKIPIPKRHLDSFGGYEYNMGAKRGIILHTDRYQNSNSKSGLMDQWDSPKVFEGLSQRERLRAELEYMERLRYVKRRREVLPHRAQIDLLMGGKKVDFVERFDIQKEIQKLKSLIMPQNARDLFHGRGIPLPTEHSSVKPRRPPLIDYDSDEDSTQPAYLRRSRTNVSKFENAMPRSYTSVHGRPDRDLKVTPKAENVRRVDIPSAGAVPRIPQSRGRSGTNPDPGTIEIPETTENIEHDDPASMEAYEDLTDRQKMMASRTSKTASPVKPPATPNPLRGSELPQMIPETERSELHATFKKLDTDSDGYV